MRARGVRHRHHGQGAARRHGVEGNCPPSTGWASASANAARHGRSGLNPARTDIAIDSAEYAGRGAGRAACAVLTGRTRCGSAPSSSNTATGLLEAGARALVGDVQDRLADVALADLEQRVDQVFDVGGRPGLVVDGVDGAVGGGQPAQDGHDVVAVAAGVHPGGAHDVGVGHRGQHGQLTGELGASVDTQRRGLVADLVGVPLLGRRRRSRWRCAPAARRPGHRRARRSPGRWR